MRYHYLECNHPDQLRIRPAENIRLGRGRKRYDCSDPDRQPSFVSRLLELDGIVCVVVEPFHFRIVKDPSYRWHELKADIDKVLNETLQPAF